jgi:class 3 adenylate cyclase/pimeloyl-ACP methyl ester carboxylesterase
MQEQKHRLAAIMFTDIVGYTAIMGEDEKKALELLEKNRKLHKPIIKKFQGTFLKEIGDAILVSFQSVYDAIRCAKQIILATKSDKDLSLRIGVHQGDVVFTDGDVYGDGVNIASRIQELAVPDCVLISGRVYEEIKNKTDIQVIRLGSFQLKNDYKTREIYAISNPGLAVPEPGDLKISSIEDKPPEIKTEVPVSEKKHKPFLKRISDISPRTGLLLIFTFMALIFGSMLIINMRQNPKITWARQEALPRIQQLIDDNDFKEAFDLALEAEKYILNDSILQQYWPKISNSVDLDTDPLGAEISIRSIYESDSNLIHLGESPLAKQRIYRDYSIWQIEKPGYHTKKFIASAYEMNNANIKLIKSDSLGEDEINVPFYGWRYRPFGTLALMKFHALPELNDFIIDKYEVTNKQFKVFVDDGGYRKKEYWDLPVKQAGKVLPFEEAMDYFVDRTGQKGPATWEIGDYPEGEENFPVSGISWYEAAAYANYAGKSLPTVYHWMYAGTPLLANYIGPYSNFSTEKSARVGEYQGIGFFGTYDMAGNVREWCQNIQTDSGHSYILGGGWSDDPYSYNIIYAQDPFDRSEINGFRCIQYIDRPDDMKIINGEIPVNYRDYSKEEPVDDQTYEILIRQFNYDPTELNPQIEYLTTDDQEVSYEKIIIDAAYGNERLPMYLLLPKNAKPPYQTIIWFPSTAAFEVSRPERFIDSFMKGSSFYKNGRAVLFPAYKLALGRSDGTFFERFRDMESTGYKDLMIMWIKDVSRCIDYLETRSDINSEAIGYAGVSLGAANGAVIPAVEKRIKVAILNVAGLWHTNVLPEIDQINYLPRIDIPVLMINGKYDHIFPLESSQNPMFELLGTSTENKKHFVYEYGHHVPWHIAMRESFSWLDKYLGPVEIKE